MFTALKRLVATAKLAAISTFIRALHLGAVIDQVNHDGSAAFPSLEWDILKVARFRSLTNASEKFSLQDSIITSAVMNPPSPLAPKAPKE